MRCCGVVETGRVILGEVWISPAKNEPRPRLNQRKAREDDPVHEPWGQLGGVRGSEGLVGSEDWEEDGEDRADYIVSALPWGHVVKGLR